jgi:CheY-like chemotaxis protein
MPHPKPKLLVVDDEPSIRTLLTQIFGRLGHPVRAAQDGFDALEQIREDVPDILLSDLNMPGMSGFELLSVVRRKLPNIYVIASSGAFSGDQVPHGIAADAFHEKSSGLGDLFQIFERAIESVPSSHAGRSASTPIWISPSRRTESSDADVLLTCPECLRAFSFTVGVADFVIHQTACVFCDTPIHYATVQPMNPSRPHRFESLPPRQLHHPPSLPSEPVSSPSDPSGSARPTSPGGR